MYSLLTDTPSNSTLLIASEINRYLFESLYSFIKTSSAPEQQKENILA